MQSLDTINPALRNFDSLPDSGYIRLPILRALLGVSSATVWRMVQAQKIKAYKLTARTTAFKVREVRALLASTVEAK